MFNLKNKTMKTYNDFTEVYILTIKNDSEIIFASVHELDARNIAQRLKPYLQRDGINEVYLKRYLLCDFDSETREMIVNDFLK
jgi:hypothetical protein